LFGEIVVGEEEATGEAGAVLLWPERFLIGVLEREGPSTSTRSRRARTKRAEEAGMEGT
jgi:hypothetical protein